MDTIVTQLESGQSAIHLSSERATPIIIAQRNVYVCNVNIYITYTLQYKSVELANFCHLCDVLFLHVPAESCLSFG